MILNRRRFLWLTGAAPLAWWSRALCASPDPGTTAMPPALGPFLDTLLPAGAGRPSATQVNADRWIAESSPAAGALKSLVHRGCRWLDYKALARGADDFASLVPAEQQTICAEAARSRHGSLQRRFFDRLREEAFSCYYADPRTWPGLGFRGPPQPLGYLDFARPPEPR